MLSCDGGGGWTSQRWGRRDRGRGGRGRVEPEAEPGRLGRVNEKPGVALDCEPEHVGWAEEEDLVCEIDVGLAAGG